MLVTTYEQFKNLPYNRGLDTKTVYKRWLLEENKLQMVYDCFTMTFQMQNTNFMTAVMGNCGPATGASSPATIPLTGVTYYTPNGKDGITLGYYTPDLDDLINSYYIYV